MPFAFSRKSPAASDSCPESSDTSAEDVHHSRRPDRPVEPVTIDTPTADQLSSKASTTGRRLGMAGQSARRIDGSTQPTDDPRPRPHHCEIQPRERSSSQPALPATRLATPAESSAPTFQGQEQCRLKPFFTTSSPQTLKWKVAITATI